MLDFDRRWRRRRRRRRRGLQDVPALTRIQLDDLILGIPDEHLLSSDGRQLGLTADQLLGQAVVDHYLIAHAGGRDDLTNAMIRESNMRARGRNDDVREQFFFFFFSSIAIATDSN